MLPSGRTPPGHVAFAPVHLAPLDSGDALHCERENIQLVVENDGDCLFQLKGNQPTALAEAERIAAAGAPLLPAPQKIVATDG